MTRQSYATEIRIIRVMCTGRVDPSFVLRALSGGADGVIIGGCWPGECHYATEGNYHALGITLLLKKLLGRVGVAPERLRIEWISAAEGARFAEVMSDFADQLRKLGPLGREDGAGAVGLRFRLRALRRLVPYLKLVEREKLRVDARDEEAWRTFYESAEAERLVDEMVSGPLVTSQILLLLSEGPQSTREISERMNLSPSDVSRHLGDSSRQGLVKFDRERMRYALA